MNILRTPEAAFENLQDFPFKEKIPKLEMKLLQKEKVCFVNVGNHHLLIQSSKIDNYDLYLIPL